MPNEAKEPLIENRWLNQFCYGISLKLFTIEMYVIWFLLRKYQESIDFSEKNLLKNSDLDVSGFMAPLIHVISS